MGIGKRGGGKHFNAETLKKIRAKSPEIMMSVIDAGRVRFKDMPNPEFLELNDDEEQEILHVSKEFLDDVQHFTVNQMGVMLSMILNQVMHAGTGLGKASASAVVLTAGQVAKAVQAMALIEMVNDELKGNDDGETD